MAIRYSLLTLISFSVLSATSGRVGADPLHVWQSSYRILPRASVLTQTFPELERATVSYRVHGTFDFRVLPTPLAVFPPVFNAKFVEPDIWAAHPHQDFVLDVNEIFNLEGITGVGQSRAFPYRPNLFRFKGVNSTRSNVRLNALAVGPWMYLRGDVTPPQDADGILPEFELRAIARRQPSGDVNGDGVVDGLDLRAWLNAPVADGREFLEWQRSLGEEPPSLEALDIELNAALAATAAAIPEPSGLTAALLAGGAMLIAARRTG